MIKEIIFELIKNKTFIITFIIALTPFFVKILGSLLTKRTRSQEETINQDIIINSYVSELKHQTSADLVFIFKYHNGGHFYDGKPMEKMTMYYVRSNDHINVETQKYINIPISYFGDMVHQLYLKGSIIQDEILICNREDDLKDNRYRNMMINLKMQSHYATATYKKILKINVKWDNVLTILWPFKYEKVLVNSIHYCLEEPYSDKASKHNEIISNKANGELITGKIQKELLK